jgi:hypothetical protein
LIMINKIIFTTCTASYLAQAKSLGDSIAITNPDYMLCIGLVDKINGRFDIAAFLPHEITEVETIEVPAFDEMKNKYSLLELRCALKPWFTLYFMKKFSAKQIIYLDTDILVTNSLQFIEEQLLLHSVLLTPHIMSPLPIDGKRPHETGILKTGIYNAGFFAVNNDDTGKKFLNWWKEILLDYCYEDSSRGLASDQSWLNFVPLFFNNVGIIKHPGCNAAYWNLHERNIEKKNNKFIVNKEYPLIFFHFSGYSFKHPELLSKHQDRFSMSKNIAVKELFMQYNKALMVNRHEEMLKIPCSYRKPKRLLQKLGLKK